MVVERSRASYLIDILGMLKVEGSNPGFAVYFDKLQSFKKNGGHATSPSDRIAHEVDACINKGRPRQSTEIAVPNCIDFAGRRLAEHVWKT